MSLRVAITRASPGAEQTADRVRAMGHEAVLAQLLVFAPRAFDTNLDGAQALLFTSAAGVRAFAAVCSNRDLPVLAVGDATADSASEAGFADLKSADGDGDALARLACATLKTERGRVIHISGADVAGDLVGALAAAGFTAERRIAYAAGVSETLPETLREPLDLMLFHSPRAAQTFVQLGAPGAAQLIAACLSPAVAEAASASGELTWRRLIVAPAPREDALLQAALTA